VASVLLGGALRGDDDAAEVLHKVSLSHKGSMCKSSWVFTVIPDRDYTAKATAAREAARAYAKSNKVAIKAQFGYTILKSKELTEMEGEAMNDEMAIVVEKLADQKDAKEAAHYAQLGAKPAKARFVNAKAQTVAVLTPRCPGEEADGGGRQRRRLRAAAAAQEGQEGAACGAHTRAGGASGEARGGAGGRRGVGDCSEGPAEACGGADPAHRP